MQRPLERGAGELLDALILDRPLWETLTWRAIPASERQDACLGEFPS
jgi:hypothetical protein